jgi:transcriptional regulator with XRE-family HTH domain
VSEKLFSERLSESLKASGLSQSQVAKQAGITAPYLSDLKKGKRGNPSTEVVRKLAAALKTSPFWLMGYEDDEHPTHYQRANGTWVPKKTAPEPPPAPADEKPETGSMDYKAVFLSLAENSDLEWLQSRIMDMSRRAAEGDVTAGQAVAALAPIVRRRLELLRSGGTGKGEAGEEPGARRSET